VTTSGEDEETEVENDEEESMDSSEDNIDSDEERQAQRIARLPFSTQKLVLHKLTIPSCP